MYIQKYILYIKTFETPLVHSRTYTLYSIYIHPYSYCAYINNIHCDSLSAASSIASSSARFSSSCYFTFYFLLFLDWASTVIGPQSLF